MRTLTPVLGMMVLLLGAGGAFGVQFSNITIGDVDGFGRGNGIGLYSCNKTNTALCDAATYTPANVDGAGLLKEYDYLPDIDAFCEQNNGVCSRHVWWTCYAESPTVCTGTQTSDDWDLREADELNNTAITGGGYVAATGCSGAKFTDLTLSRSFSDTFPLIPFPTGLDSNPIAGECEDSPLVNNQPTFTFDFKVPTTAGGITSTMTELWLNMLFGDYEVGQMAIKITPHNNAAIALTIDPNKQKMPDQDGLIQPMFRNLLQFFTFSQLFTTVVYNGTNHYYCHLDVEVLDGPDASGDPETPGEPYTAYDFCQISLTPPFCILRVGPSRAYTTIQSAINAATNGCTIVVDPSTYNENISFGGKNIVVQSVTPTDPTCVDATIIDGTGTTSVVTFNGAETGRCVLSGFTITGGNAANGGAVNGTGTKANINHCVIELNTASNGGGGLYNCQGPILNCTIQTNTASHGGGLCNCHGLIEDCSILSNTATYGGGLDNCDGAIQNCTIQSNTVTSYGGGLSNCNGTIKRCSIFYNDGGSFGGGLFACDRLEQCGVFGNVADYLAAGMYGGLYVVNCSFSWNGVSTNTYDTGVAIHSTASNAYIVHNTMSINAGGLNVVSMKAATTATVVNNIATNTNDYAAVGAFARKCLLGGAPSTPDARGNFYASPGFVSIFNLHLTASSPAINAGSTTLGIPIDFDGDTRDSAPDIGGDEYRP